MGLEKNKVHEKREGGRKRGSVRNDSRLANFTGRGVEGGADWSNCSSDLMLEVISRITSMGGAITISLSRDKGAHGLTLMLDDARKSMWYNGDADLDAELTDTIARLEAVT